MMPLLYRANFIENKTRPLHYPRDKNRRMLIDIQPRPAGSDQFNKPNSDQTHTSKNTAHGPFNKYERQQIEAEVPDLDDKQETNGDESTSDQEQFIGGHIIRNEHQQQLIGGQMIHNQSENSVVMIGTNRSSSLKSTNKDSPPNILEDDGSPGTRSTNDGSTIQGCTQNSGDPFAPLSPGSTPLTESSNPLHPSSGGATGTPTSSNVSRDLSIHLPSSSSRRPIESEYAEFNLEANREQIEQHIYVYPSRSVSSQVKGTMLMCWYAAAMLLIL
uniref:Uncharacterized protein n=1 Tax=Cacopsylla melanoneura TaxID=428564 RepID=A0A8D9BXZ4_9HEMI